MFFAMIIVASIITLLIFVQNRKGQNSTLFTIIGGISFAFSWVLVVMWFTVLIEGWQIALNTPMVNHDLLPMWEHIGQRLLHTLVGLFPAPRLGLAVIYASPILLLPLLLIGVNRLRVTSILLYSALVNLLFFWVLFMMDSWSSLAQSKTVLEGVVSLTTYALVLYALVRQRPFVFSFQHPST